MNRPLWFDLIILVVVISCLMFAIFLLLPGNAFAMCTGKAVRQTDVALFSNATEANDFALKKHGMISVSDDGKTFSVIYLTTIIVTNVPDNCESE